MSDFVKVLLFVNFEQVSDIVQVFNDSWTHILKKIGDRLTLRMQEI